MTDLVVPTDAAHVAHFLVRILVFVSICGSIRRFFRGKPLYILWTTTSLGFELNLETVVRPHLSLSHHTPSGVS